MKTGMLWFAGLVLCANAVWATTYTWTGNGGDTCWTNAANWTGGAAGTYPGTATDEAVITAAEAIALPTNGMVTLWRLYDNATAAKTVTLSGGPGSGLSFAGTVNDATGGNRIFLNQRNIRLVFDTDIRLPAAAPRLMITGDNSGATKFGTIEYKKDILCEGSSQNIFIDGTNLFTGTSRVILTNAYVKSTVFGGTYSVLILTNQTQWTVKGLCLGVTGSPTHPLGAKVYQVSEESKVDVRGTLEIGNHAGPIATDITSDYFLRQGELVAQKLQIGSYMNTTSYETPGRFEMSGGTFRVTDTAACVLYRSVFRQTGGTSYLPGFSMGIPAYNAAEVYLEGGDMFLGGNVTTPFYQPQKQIFELSGGILHVTNTVSCTIPVTFRDAVTIDVSAGKTNSLGGGIFGTGDLVKTGAGVLQLGDGNGTTNRISGSLTISNGTVRVAAKTLVESYGFSTNTLRVKICSGATLKIASTTSVMAVPLDLDVETGGHIEFEMVSPNYPATILVARSLRIDGGAPQASAFYIEGQLGGLIPTTSPSGMGTIAVPVIWTGAGDGTTWNDGANWSGGNAPNGSTAIADVSMAERDIRVDSAVDLNGLVYNPQTAKRSLTLTGGGSVRMYARAIFYPVIMIGQNSSLVFDVPFDDARNGTAPFGVVGNGNLVIRKGFPAGYTSRMTLLICGNLVFEGAADVATVLGVGKLGYEGYGTLTFAPGCRVACRRFASNITRIWGINEVFHNGGDLVCGDFYYTCHFDGNKSLPLTYHMAGGTLTATNSGGIALGIPYPDRADRAYAGGIFEMTGGTVTTERFILGTNTVVDVLRLYGGDVYLGAGGIAPEKTVKCGVRLGGVTLHAEADWSTAMPLILSYVNGHPTVDTGTHTVTFSNAVSGTGGLVKRGAGILALNGTNTFTGPLVVEQGAVTCGAGSSLNGPAEISVREGATLTVGGTLGATVQTLDLAGTGSLSLASGLSLAVNRLYIGGVPQAEGSSHTFGSGTVTVATTGALAWIGPDGGNWTTPGNWINAGGSAPGGPGAVVDFSYSALSTNAQIVLDSDVTLTNLVYNHSGSGNVLTLTCPAGTTRTLTFSGKATVTVADGQTLVLDTDVYLQGILYKRGLGTLVVKRHTRADGAALAGDLPYQFIVIDGVVRGQGQFSGLYIQPSAASTNAVIPEFILEGTSAAVTNAAMIKAGGAFSGSGYYPMGIFTQIGGAVDLAAMPTYFKTNKKGFLVSATNLTYGTYNLTGGTLKTHPSYPAYLSTTADARSTFNQSGGVSTFYNLSLTGWDNLSSLLPQAVLKLSGGTMQLSGTVERGPGTVSVNLSGGQIKSLLKGDVFSYLLPVTLSAGITNVSFAQAAASQTNTLPNTLSGDGGLTQAGPGTLVLEGGENLFSGQVAVEGGTLLVDSPLWLVPGVSVAGGQAVLQAAAPMVTNLSVRVAGASVTLRNGGTVLGEDLTVTLVKDSVLDLDYDGVVMAEYLYLNGLGKVPGLYGGPDCAVPGARKIAGYFEGTGALSVQNTTTLLGTMIFMR